MEETNVNKFYKAERNIEEIIYLINNLSNSFFNIGNEELGQKLYRWAYEIKENKDVMTSCFSGEIHDRFKTSQEMSATILTACLNTNELNKKKE